MAELTKEQKEIVAAQATEQEPMTWQKAQELAEQFECKPRQIQSVVTRTTGLFYEKKARVGKSGKPVESKSDIVAAIAGFIDCDVESLDGLDKASKPALETVRDALEIR